MGKTLTSVLRERGVLTPMEVASLLRQVCDGLAAAHAAGVIHRDIKPSNLMLMDGEMKQWKVLDFGISKLLGSGTLTGDALIGTPGYMAPEQAFGTDVDGRADVFALGAVTYRALTGVPAFAGKDAMATVMHAAQRQPPSPRALVDLSEELELVLALALAKDRADRLSSVEQLATAFEQACDGKLSKGLVRDGRKLLRRMPWSDALAVVPREDATEGGTAVAEESQEAVAG